MFTHTRTLSVIFVALATSLAGCGMSLQQQTAVRKFGVATETLADLATRQLTDSRAAVIEMNTLRAKLGDESLRVDANVSDTATTAQLAGFLKEEHLAARLAALGALRTYAELLQTLAGTSDRPAVRASIDAFVSSLRRAELVELDEPHAAAIAQVASFAADQIIEAQRAKLMATIVRNAEPIVLRVVELLREDLDEDAQQWAFAYLETTRLLEQAATIADTLRTVDPQSEQGVGPVVIEARLTAQRHREAFTQSARELLEAVEQLRLAQVNLRGAMQSPKVTIEDLDALVTRMQSTVDAIAVIRTMQ